MKGALRRVCFFFGILLFGLPGQAVLIQFFIDVPRGYPLRGHVGCYSISPEFRSQ